MIGELQDQQQVTAASAAAATQRSPAAGASEGLGSQVKNLAFPPFLILQDTCLCPGLVYIPSPGSMSRCISKNFWEFSGVFIPKLTQELRARARCLLTGARTKMAETLVFLREFRSLNAGPAAHPGCWDPGRWVRENFWEFSGVFKEFWGVWIRQLRTGRRAPGREVIHRLSTDFFILGSLGV